MHKKLNDKMQLNLLKIENTHERKINLKYRIIKKITS